MAILTRNGVDDTFLKNVLAEMVKEYQHQRQGSRGNLLHLVGPADARVEYMLEDDEPAAAAAMIINTQTSSEPGEHWVALFADNALKKAFLFNSLPLAGKLFPENVVKQLLSKSYELHYENRDLLPLQNPTLPLCGFYCLAWLLCHIKNEKLELCATNWTLNDAIVVTKVWPYVEKIYA